VKRKEPLRGHWVNWSLVIAGIICVIIALAMGAMTGFDLALVGAALAVGGGIGLLDAAQQRRYALRGRRGLDLLCAVPQLAEVQADQCATRLRNVDAVLGKTGVVTKARRSARQPVL